jgi:4-diphosphocytidyl-2-C-methyl-D-erythritol kinase
MLVSQGEGPLPPSARSPNMRLAIRGAKVLVRAPAKVNLFLEVLGKRPDGYHEIATLMVAVGLMDTLVFKEEPDLRLGCNRPDLSTGHDNLVLRAARLLKERTGCAKGAHIRLVKRIPMAAGLAGGSTDAAATLWGLSRLWNLDLTQDDLEKLGAELGSDIPFFFHTPAAWCTGRGEIVSPMPLGRTLDLVLLCPNFGCPTAQVYKNVAVPAAAEQGEAIRRALERGAITEIGRLLFNRLQAAAEKLAPAITTYHHRLARLMPAGQLMSGSGSSLFALCRDRPEAERLAQELRHGADRELFTVFLVRSCS